MAKSKSVVLDSKMQKKLATLGIEEVTTEAEAKETILEKLTEAGYEGFEDETLESLVDIYEATVEPEPETTKKSTKKAKVVEPEPEEEEEEEAETEEEEEEEETPAPPKKATKKAPVKAVVTEEEEDDLAEEVATKKPAKAPAKVKKTEPAKPRNSNAFDKNNDEHISLVTKLFAKVFDMKKYAVSAITSGMSLRLLGDNVKIVILKYNNITFDGKKMIGDLNFKKIRSTEELQNLLPESFEDKEIEKVNTRNYCKINDVTGDELVELLSDETVVEAVVKKGKSIDSKMGANREKLEQSLANDKKSTKKVTAKAPEPEEEEEEEETPASVKKAVTKKAVAKKK